MENVIIHLVELVSAQMYNNFVNTKIYQDNKFLMKDNL